ncbi:CDP-alcohol phosphatidyltransferase [Microbacterium sp.]|uniref:CDP-alcohol phosphatidyltransferase n=1 Tax=Microbacterium sp. TaxID=51671 RepID=UPI003A94B328
MNAPARPLARAATVLAVLLLVIVPVIPAFIATGAPAQLVRVPGESLVILLVLALVPWRAVRVVLAAAFGVFVVAALVLGGIDRGYRAVLGTRFDPLDWPQLGGALGVASDAVGPGLVTAAVVLLAIAAAATIVALAWAALRVDAAIRRRLRRGVLGLSAVTAGWIVAALVGSALTVAPQVSAAASLDTVGSAVDRASGDLRARVALSPTLADDPFADVPPAELLTALRGKDVLLVFVESYGRVAVEGSSFSGGVDAVLRRGDEMLAAHGYAAQSAWLTSPTFAGLSWLAHATLQTGVWADSPTAYNAVVSSTRMTLSDAFGKAGWRTVGDIPSNIRPWPVGSRFYHYDTLLGAGDVGYRGPVFGYARVPDQYTLKHFADTELGAGHAPVMAEIDLVSSHTPWAPLPQLVPWEQIGDGAVFDGQPARSRTAADVWQHPHTVQRFYGQSIEYALGSLFSFLANIDDPNLVVIALGDHQPATIVSGTAADRTVPISVIARDPKVVRAIDSWAWTPGMRPGEASPVWRMDAFRDRFLTAFGPVG